MVVFSVTYFQYIPFKKIQYKSKKKNMCTFKYVLCVLILTKTAQVFIHLFT